MRSLLGPFLSLLLVVGCSPQGSNSGSSTRQPQPAPNSNTAELAADPIVSTPAREARAALAAAGLASILDDEGSDRARCEELLSGTVTSDLAATFIGRGERLEWLDVELFPDDELLRHALWCFYGRATVGLILQPDVLSSETELGAKRLATVDLGVTSVDVLRSDIMDGPFVCELRWSTAGFTVVVEVEAPADPDCTEGIDGAGRFYDAIMSALASMA